MMSIAFCTQDLMGQEGLNEARSKANAMLASGENGSVRHTWIYDQKQFYDGIKQGNAATSFLDSYTTTVDILINSNSTATYTFTVKNISGWEPGTRLGKAAKPGGPHQAVISNKDRIARIKFGGNLNEKWLWQETVLVSVGTLSTPRR